MKKMSLIVLILALCMLIHAGPISIDFNGFKAQFSQNQGLILTLKCSGGKGALQYQFKNLPTDWKISGNQIIVENFSVTVRKSWRFDIYVTDAQGNYLSQTLMLNFMGAYIGLTSVTLPVTGINAITNNNLISFFGTNNQQNIQNNSFNQGLYSQQPKIADLVSQYPGLDPLNKLTTGFGVPNDSPIAADLISTSRATYNPMRDSTTPSLFKTQKQAALNRQSQANQKISTLGDMVIKISASINKLKQDAIDAEQQANNSRTAVNQCDKALFDLQDTKIKVNNAITDKQSKVDQYYAEISKANILIQSQSEKLNSFEQLKKKAENQSMPNSKTLQNLQRTLDQCKNNLIQNTKKAEQGKIQSETTQTQIKMLNIQTNQAKTKLIQINIDLDTIRQKITSLTQQLQQAKKQQLNILKDKQRYEQVPINNDRKVQQLQSQITNITNTNTISDCKIYETPLLNLQNILNKDRDNYNNIIKQIQDQKQTVDNLKNNLLDLKKSLGILPMEISTLKNQINTYDTSINRTSYLCQDSVTQYSKAAITFQNTKEKVDSTQKQLDKVTNQLTQAQAQLLAANTALTEINNSQASSLSNRNKVTNNYNVVLPSTSTIPNTPSSPIFQNQNKNFLPPLFNVNASTSNSNANSNSISNNRNNTPSIDDIVKYAINNANKQKVATDNIPSTVTYQQAQSSTSPTTTIPPSPSLNAPAPLPISAVSDNSDSSFSISNYLTQTNPSNNANSQSSDTNLNNQISQNINTPQLLQSIKPPSYSINSNPPIKSTVDQYQPIPLPLNKNPLTLSFNEVIDDSFKISRNQGSKSAYVADVKGFLKKANLDASNFPLSQSTYLFTLDNSSLNSLINKGSIQATLPAGTCTNPSLTDSATVMNVGLGYILVRNSQYLYRLTFSQCTKIVSTSKSSSLKQGSKVLFSGIPVVTMPNNILLNVHLIVCNPESAP